MTDVKAAAAPSTGEAPPKNLTLYWLTPFHQPYLAEVIGNPGGTIAKLKETIVKENTAGWTCYQDGKLPAGVADHKHDDWTCLQFFCPSPDTYRAPLSDSAYPSDHIVFIVSKIGGHYVDLLDPVWENVSSGFATFPPKMKSLSAVILSANAEDDDDDDGDDDDDEDDPEEEDPKTKSKSKGSGGPSKEAPPPKSKSTSRH